MKRCARTRDHTVRAGSSDLRAIGQQGPRQPLHLTRHLAVGAGLLWFAACVSPPSAHGGAAKSTTPVHSAADRNAARKLPVYKLGANAWSEVEKMERIQTVLRSRLRDLKASGEPVLSACRERELGQVGRLIAQSKKLVNDLEAALRGRDRSTAERYWLDIRANGMTVNGLLKGRCDGPDPGPIR